MKFLVPIFVLFLVSGCFFPLAIVQADGSGLVPACDYPDCSWGQLSDLFNNILTWIVTISASVAAIAIGYAGYLFMRHSANPGKREEAKKVLWRAIIGLLVVISAALIVKVILNALVSDAYPGLKNLIK